MESRALSFCFTEFSLNRQTDVCIVSPHAKYLNSKFIILVRKITFVVSFGMFFRLSFTQYRPLLNFGASWTLNLDLGVMSIFLLIP